MVLDALLAAKSAQATNAFAEDGNALTDAPSIVLESDVQQTGSDLQEQQRRWRR
jgi:hypothetical protein